MEQETHKMNLDGYMNMLSKYGTRKDSHETYQYVPDAPTPDMELAQIYSSNGLFATIIDNPAELALKNGFELGIADPEIENYVTRELTRLHWSPRAVTAEKWTRLFGGAAILINADDGADLDEPLDMNQVTRIDNLVVFERPEIQPDYTALYSYVPDLARMDKLGTPEYYLVSPIYGGTQVRVHESRLMIFRNGEMPRTGVRNSDYMFFGIPEYNRIKRELRDTTTTHGNGYRMLERCVQAVMKINNLSALMTTEDGEDQVIRRLQLIDMARSLINTMVIDSEGEDYMFQTFTLAGAKDIVDESCNMLSAVTHIPQTILFGRSPAGENATGESDLTNYYDYVGQIQNPGIVDNLHRLVDAILMAGLHQGKIGSIPDHEITPKPLWSLDEKQQAELDQAKAQTSFAKAQTAQVYLANNVLDPTEIRKTLASAGDFDIEEVLPDDGDELNLPDDTFGDVAELGQPIEIAGAGENAAAEGIEIEIPEQELGLSDKIEISGSEDQKTDAVQGEQVVAETPIEVVTPPEESSPQSHGRDTKLGAAVLIIHDGKILCARRKDDGTICGPGGHVEEGETPEQAATRETQEEFSITPLNLLPLGDYKASSGQYCDSRCYFTDTYTGEPATDEDEMHGARWMTLEELQSEKLFPPFASSIDQLEQLMQNYLTTDPSTDTLDEENNNDGAPFGNKNAAGPHKGKEEGKGNKPRGKNLVKRMSGKEREKVSSDINNVFHARFQNMRRGMITTYAPNGKTAYDYYFDIGEFGSYKFTAKVKNGG